MTRHMNNEFLCPFMNGSHAVPGSNFCSLDSTMSNSKNSIHTLHHYHPVPNPPPKKSTSPRT